MPSCKKKAEKPEKKKPFTQAELAELWGMTQQNVAKMIKQGMPMDSVESATAWRKKFLEERTPTDYNEARTKKALLECEKLEMQLAILKGDYVLSTQVRESGIRIGAILTAKFAALVNDASGALAGLDEMTQRRTQKTMTRSQLWKIYTDRNPSFDGDGNVTMTARGLRKMFETTWDVAYFDGEMESDEPYRREQPNGNVEALKSMFGMK
jgi:transposase